MTPNSVFEEGHRTPITFSFNTVAFHLKRQSCDDSLWLLLRQLENDRPTNHQLESWLFASRCNGTPVSVTAIRPGNLLEMGLQCYAVRWGFVVVELPSVASPGRRFIDETLLTACYRRRRRLYIYRVDRKHRTGKCRPGLENEGPHDKTTGDVKAVACYSTARASHARAMDWGGHFVDVSTLCLPERIPEVDRSTDPVN